LQSNILKKINPHLSKIFVCSYATVQRHPNPTPSPQATTTTTTTTTTNSATITSKPLDIEKVIRAVEETLKEEEITQETMLGKISLISFSLTHPLIHISLSFNHLIAEIIV
jgi:hypothetical protein